MRKRPGRRRPLRRLSDRPEPLVEVSTRARGARQHPLALAGALLLAGVLGCGPAEGAPTELQGGPPSEAPLTASAPGPAPSLPAPRQPTLTEVQARDVFACLRQRSRMLYHPEGLVALQPDKAYRFDWAEHPEGQIEMRTDANGLREDPGWQPRAGVPLVLALGDSHTDGTVNNAETWPNVLERLLADAGHPADVLNAGVGSTGPEAYLGTLRRLAPLRPDVVVVGLYTGNDFLNALMVHDVRSGRSVRHRDRDYREPLVRAMRAWGSIVAQGFNQAYLFARFPADAELALTATIKTLDELAAVCDALDARLVVSMLPTKPDADRGDDTERVEALWDALSLGADARALNDRMADRLVEALTARGLSVLDPRPAFRADPRRLYWLEDHHLAVTGQTLFAERLLPTVSTLLHD